MPDLLPRPHAPSGEPVEQFQRASRRTAPRNRHAVRHHAAWAALALGAALAATGCTAGTVSPKDAVMPSTAGSSATGLTTSAPLETPTTTQTSPVYWLGHSNDAVYLYREFQPTPGTDDPIVAALRAMMTTKPKDPDYFSVWDKPSRIGASISAKNVITVDVSSDAFAQKVDTGIAQRSIAQLVYTATAAASMAGLIDPAATVQVSVLVDGHTGYQAFGHVPLTKPLTRDAGFVAPVWIVDPGNGATFKTLPLKVSGQAMSPSGTLGWALAPMVDGKASGPVLTGTVAIPQGPDKLGTFNFNVVPPLGSYELSVFIADPKAPNGRAGVDTKVVTLTGH
ncbi:GerMN domain-containing protein [Arthrobacter sp. A2-55]|uniref:GerMN domain-containing protein n=1 Tax=Arthrobacter sp. A2-55 TaxID=2897337 RepID=UPI0021CD646B|nr:GerMN domain-containing protein [Arthrobacter sp. A2-55]MCU6478744.1 GerMN domain-containing protein [Arthrobacter sp. A2-55]